ncbi:MAG: hypothetical protein BAJALOKI1v1_1240010 [Promethearchaeota archaeon]|nr:MAG: hypothetical protein BAJALOKI1v1_1240010 [Candidatus Lokiarchaeota archaeon]
MIRPGHILKQLKQFALREYKEKHPLSVLVVRTKPKTLFTRGFLSSLRVTQQQVSQYAVICTYQKHARVYSFSTAGKLLGAENVENSPEFKKKMQKNASKLLVLPKK